MKPLGLLMVASILVGLAWLVYEKRADSSTVAELNSTALDAASEPSSPPSTQAHPSSAITSHKFEGASKADQPTPAAEEQYEPPILAGQVLTVISAATELPVPNADVWFLAPESPSQFKKSQAEAGFLPDWFEDVQQKGRHFRCNAQGQTRLPRGDINCTVVAAKAGAIGAMFDFGNQPGPIELALQPPVKIRVKVVDTNDQAVPGISVRLRVSFNHYPYAIDALRAKTQADGIAVLKHVETFKASAGEQLKAMNLVVALALPMLKPVTRSIDLEDMPSDPIVLRLPRTKAVSVRVRTPNGGPPPVGTSVMLGLPGSERRAAKVPKSPVATTCDAQGNATLHHVPSMKEWGLTAWHASVPSRVAAISEDYEQEGLPSVIDVEWDPKFARYRTRCFTQDGKPAANRSISWKFENARGVIGTTTADAAGYLDFYLPPLLTSRVRLVFFLQGSVPPQAVTQRVQMIIAEVLEIPDLHLKEVPILAQGRVLTPDGKPCSRSQVVISGVRKNFDDQRALSGSHLPRVAWTDHEGRFVIRGYYPTKSPLIVHAYHETYAAAKSKPAPASSSPLELLLSR